jgi:hypothetical protein
MSKQIKKVTVKPDSTRVAKPVKNTTPTPKLIAERNNLRAEAYWKKHNAKTAEMKAKAMKGLGDFIAKTKKKKK